MEFMLSFMFLLSRACLVGSRGRARLYKYPEPENSDYDWSVYTDDPELIQACFHEARKICILDPSFRIIARGTMGWTLHSKEKGVDINVKPSIVKFIMLRSWRLMEQGTPKDEAWKDACAHYGMACRD